MCNETISIDGTEKNLSGSFEDSLMFLGEQQDAGQIDIDFTGSDE